MKFSEIYESSSPVYSLEFFPPKDPQKIETTKSLMKRMARLDPHFMTVTYGAGGGTRVLTGELTAYIAGELSIPAVAHLTCVGHSREEIRSVLDALENSGISNVLALRGDPPKGQDTFEVHPDGFTCARDLCRFIVDRGGFSAAVAGYPECHHDAADWDSELNYLREKQEAGAEVIITQLFFEAELYFRYTERARAAGVTLPIVPGIMPISNFKQLKRFTSLCGATVPQKIISALEPIQEDKEAVRSYGTELAFSLCRELLRGGAPGIHFYTLNKSFQVEDVLSQLRTRGEMS